MTVLSAIEIKNFQSLKNVKLDLQPFTVITGRSSSGKSAFFRSLRLLVSNQRGASFVTNGERQCTITAHFKAGPVTLKRGADNEYILPGDQKWTKLNGAVPEEVSKFMGIPAKNPINMAGQFDKPYLLDDTAGEAAKILGELTNVRVIFDASRESNRRKLAKTSTLKTRAEDLQKVRDSSVKFKGLADRRKAVEGAEQGLETVLKLDQQVDTLKSLQTKSEAAQATLDRVLSLSTMEIPSLTRLNATLTRVATLKKLQARLATAESKIAEARKIEDIELPSTMKFEALVKRRTELREFKEAIAKAIHSYSTWKGFEKEALEAENKAQADYIEALQQLGVCPTCGQDTKDVH